MQQDSPSCWIQVAEKEDGKVDTARSCWTYFWNRVKELQKTEEESPWVLVSMGPYCIVWNSTKSCEQWIGDWKLYNPGIYTGQGNVWTLTTRMMSPQQSHGLSVGSLRVHVWLFRLNYPYSEGYSRSALTNLRNRLNVIKQSVSTLATLQDKTQLPLKEDDKIQTINNIKFTMSIIH